VEYSINIIELVEISIQLQIISIHNIHLEQQIKINIKKIMLLLLELVSFINDLFKNSNLIKTKLQMTIFSNGKKSRRIIEIIDLIYLQMEQIII